MPDDLLDELAGEPIEPVDLIEVYQAPEAWPQPPEEWGKDVEDPGVIT